MLVISKEIPAKFSDIIKDGYQKLNSLWPIDHKVTFKLNSGKTRNGYCHKNSYKSYDIHINKDLVKTEDILEVVVHELLHSYPEVFPQGHRGEWKLRGEKVNKTYGIKVSRCNTFERATTYKTKTVKFKFECTECGHIFNYCKKPKWFDRIAQVKCPFCKTHSIAQVLCEYENNRKTF